MTSETGAPAAGRPKATHTSHTISLARVICVFGIVYVHAWTGQYGGALERLATSPEGILRIILMEGVGRSAVPLLGMISGWLVGSSAEKRGYGAFLYGKARTILLPMLLWNLFSIVFVSGAAYLGWIQAPIPTNPWWFLDELLCFVTPNDINVQTYFLRDLFLCMALAPLLVRWKDRWLLLLALFFSGWAIYGVKFPLFLRPQIMVFFSIGILARRHGLATRIGGWNAVSAMLPYLVLVSLRIPAEIFGWAKPYQMAATAFDLVLRIAAAVFFWRLCWVLADRWFGQRVRRLEPYVFLTFCSHLILLWLLGPAMGQLTGPLGSSAWYAVFFVLQPIVAFAFAIVIGRGLGAIFPDFVAVLSGGRLHHGKKTESWAPDGRVNAAETREQPA
ncbi:acyltransferase family protein [Sphingomonas sp. ID0503]|uniref:acyltransferase family protein n=1 Tax=Sphingomonas sp. ID0503 TaxID=3399691 RepID=UPI003AFB4330